MGWSEDKVSAEGLLKKYEEYRIWQKKNGSS